MEVSDVILCDVVIIGSGNAGFSAAIAAKEVDPSLHVLLLEKAPESWAGGNSAFTAGAYRTVFSGLEDLLPIVSNVPHAAAADKNENENDDDDNLIGRLDVSPYTEDDFMNDLKRLTNGRTDPALARELVQASNETTKWLAKNGVNFQLSFNRQAYQIDGRFKFWGGMVLSVVDGGKGLIKNHRDAASRLGVEVRRKEDGSVFEVRAAGGVILCAGGFEANPEMRAQYLGPGWDKAYVRGTPFNTGELLKAAIATTDARPFGNWSGCHSTCWDANAPGGADAGDQTLTNQLTKSGYPLGLMINVEGRRFVDEGLDLRNYTYAKFGREILQQPDNVCFQVWDAHGASWLREEEYGDDVVVDKVRANTIAELAHKLAARGLRGVAAFEETIANYNRATNWACPIIKPPFVAVKVTCGITFTFGGLKVDPGTSAVISHFTNAPIPGLFCAGEMLGGLFYDNYPGGSGLTAGAVFGRKAGDAAARRALTGVDG
ncbi:hypothetical protein DV738_g1360, partial [Chaetothyriales sp. CBS 135597]